MGVSITIIFVHPQHTIGPSAVSSSIFTRVALEPAIWATCPHAEVKTAEDSDHESLQSQDVDDHTPEKKSYSVSGGAKMQSLAECLRLLDPQNHEIWKFYTPNIWVITPKNEGNVGSHGKMLIDVIYTSFKWLHEDNPVGHWDPHTPRPKVPVSAVYIAWCINA